MLVMNSDAVYESLFIPKHIILIINGVSNHFEIFLIILYYLHKETLHLTLVINIYLKEKKNIGISHSLRNEVE